jgi:hypothetical protein
MSSIAIPAPQGASPVPLPVANPFDQLFPNVFASEGTDKILPALFAALENVGPAVKDSENPHLRSKYADLASNYDAAKPALHANKIRVLQPPTIEGQKVTVTTILLHESGQWIATLIEMTCRTPDPQDIGKTITYARRYAFNGLLAMIAEDDDGNAGSGVSGPQAVPQSRAPRTPNKPGPVPAPDGVEKCQDCGQNVEPTKIQGKDYTVAQLIKRSNEKYSKKMCAACQVQAAVNAKKAADASIGVPSAAGTNAAA